MQTPTPSARKELCRLEGTEGKQKGLANLNDLIVGKKSSRVMVALEESRRFSPC